MKTNIATVKLSIVFLAIGLLAGCSRGPLPAMPATQDSFGKVSDIMQEVGKNLTARDVEEGKASEEGKKAMTKKLMVEPFENAGYDLDATLKDFAVRLRDGNLTQDQGAVVMGVMGIYGEQVTNLARWGFIKEETKATVLNALKR
jgi:hypothetical protein